MNTCFYDKGIIIRNRKQIIQHYFKNRLPYDLVSILPFLINISSSHFDDYHYLLF